MMLLVCKGISISIWPISLIPTRYTLFVFIIYSVNNVCIYVVSLFSKLVFTGLFGIGRASKVTEGFTTNYLQSTHGQVIHVSVLCVCVCFFCAVSSFLYMPKFSLQVQDWTKRPLSQIMLRYARSDTQYLLEITNVLTAELKEGKKYDEAIRRSDKMCSTLYTKGQEDFKLVKTCQTLYNSIHAKIILMNDLDIVRIKVLVLYNYLFFSKIL